MKATSLSAIVLMMGCTSPETTSDASAPYTFAMETEFFAATPRAFVDGQAVVLSANPVGNGGLTFRVEQTFTDFAISLDSPGTLIELYDGPSLLGHARVCPSCGLGGRTAVLEQAPLDPGPPMRGVVHLFIERGALVPISGCCTPGGCWSE